MATTTQLSRELLRWIQSLDLAYSVKNAKRDFANGFLVAEIFSRYYERDVHMHGFSNGTSLEQKRDNWSQLTRFFKKRGIEPEGKPVEQQELNDIMKCKPGAVVEFLNKIYSFLTGRKIQAPPPRSEETPAPAFAKSTAAHAIRETLRDPGVEAITDLSTKESKMREALTQHQTSMAEDKVRDPGRYSVKRGKIVRGSTRTVGREESKSSVEIKQVAVKSVDSNVAHLRATKELQASTARMGGTNASTRSVLPDLEAAGVQPAMEILNSAVTTALTGRDELTLLDASLPPAQALVGAITDSKSAFPHALAADVFRQVSQLDNLSTLSAAGLASPREFFHIVSVFQPTIAGVAESSPAFSVAVDAMMALGKTMVSSDPHAAVKLFQDFALPSFLPLAKRRPTKRHAVMRVLYSFSVASCTGHLQAIRVLQDSLSDMTAFLHCLTVLIFLEDTFDDDLTDLYLYYTLIGMGMSSPPLRAACVAMLSVIAVRSPEVVVGAVDRLVMLRGDKWWEVRAQLLIVCATLLQHLTPATDSQSVYAMTDLVTSLMEPSNGPVVLRVGVAYLAKVLRMHPSLAPVYLRAVLALPSQPRELLLDPTGQRDQLPVAGASGGRYRLPSPAAEWPADLLMRTLSQIVSDDALEHLEVEHYQVLIALLKRCDEKADHAVLTAAGASKGFADLQNHIFVGICDEECCPYALDVLQAFEEGHLGLDVLTAPTFAPSLTLLHQLPERDPATEARVAAYLDATASKSDDHATAISGLLTAFRDSYGDLAGSGLAGVAAKVGL